MMANCKNCDGQAWVCENHSDRPWEGLSDREDACDCGAGAPCPVCNWRAAVAGVEHVAFEKGRAVGLRQSLGYFASQIREEADKIERGVA